MSKDRLRHTLLHKVSIVSHKSNAVGIEHALVAAYECKRDFSILHVSSKT